MALRSWLSHPSSQVFRAYLADCAAAATAEAGNALVKDSEAAGPDSQDYVVIAREYLAAIKILDESRDPEHNFVSTTLKPKPQTTD